MITAHCACNVPTCAARVNYRLRHKIIAARKLCARDIDSGMNIKSFVVVRSATVQLGKLLVPCKMKRIGEPGGEREVKIALLGEAGVGKSGM